MSHAAHTRPVPAPLDFDSSCPADSMIGARGPDACPHNESHVPMLDAHERAPIWGIATRTVREVLAEALDPES